MSSKYPKELDALSTNAVNATDGETGVPDNAKYAALGGKDPAGEGDHAKRHNDAADAINKMQAELGTNPSAEYSTVAARMAAAEILIALSEEALAGKQPLDADLTSLAELGSATFTGAHNVMGFLYGAKGDGVTDDAGAIQAAINAAAVTGGVVYAPPGIYLVSKTITVPANVRLVGAGWTSTVLKAKNSSNIVVLEGVNYATTGTKNGAVEQLAVDGNKANNTSTVGLKFQSQNFYFNKVIALNCDGNGFDIKLSTETEQQTVGLDNCLEGCRAIGCEDKGFNIEAHDTLMVDCQAIQCKEVGFNWTVNGYAINCHSWCWDSTLPTATKTGWRLATSVHCVDCIAEGATERQVLCPENVASWTGGEVFNGASAPNAHLFEINGGTSIMIRDPWCHDFGTGGAVHFATEGQASVIRIRAYDPGGNEAITGTPHDEVFADVIPGGGTKLGKGAYFKRKQYSFIANEGTDAPNKTLLVDIAGGRLKFKDANGTVRDFQMAAMETTASAATISVSTRGSLNKVTGTTSITKVNGTFAGHEVTLLFTSTAKLVKGENLELVGDFAGPGAITIKYDGTNWQEVGRRLGVLDTDPLLAANSDTRIATQKAVKSYVDALLAGADAVVYKGAIDCSANPNYPAAEAGHLYRVSVAGKIGGASGTNVEAGDTLICSVDGSSAGTQAAVGANWNIIQANLDGAVIGPSSATAGNIPTFNGATGKLLQDSGRAHSTDGTLASNSDNKIPTEKAVKTYADGVSLPKYDRDLKLPGLFAPMGTWPSTTLGATANRAYFMRVVPSRTITIKSVRFAVTTAATTDDPCDVGIYDAELKRICSAGATTGKLNSTGVKTITVPETVLQANTVYFVAFSYGAIGGTVAQVAGVNNNAGFYGDMFGTGTIANRLMLFAATSHPLPAGPVAPGGSTVTPWVAIGES